MLEGRGKEGLAESGLNIKPFNGGGAHGSTGRSI